jgi:hypothetical protein
MYLQRGQDHNVESRMGTESSDCGSSILDLAVEKALVPRRLGGVARDQEIFFQGEGDMEMGEVGPDGGMCRHRKERRVLSRLVSVAAFV